ncbi:sigma-70 family RNA polymerase sigma factor [Aerococcaceae bacterium DSM 111176]|nr:sigma-70 family RNA polymerase sigma factor [Aerococcaceae bacterium DSM 111176]
MNHQELENLIQEHYGLIIKTASDQAGRYVSVKNDDIFSVALIAFKEAFDKYDPQKGPFISFAKLVMQSRIIDHQRKEARHTSSSLDYLVDEENFQVEDARHSNDSDLQEEIMVWREELEQFKITLDQLADESPVHEDTRNRALDISERSSKHLPITDPLFAKKRLPIKVTAEYNNVTQKVIKGSKTFIISGIIIFFRGLRELIGWTKGGSR